MNRSAALLAAGAVATAPAALLVQLTFAIVGIGIVGMVHGAGDLAVVTKQRRPLFLTTYAVVSLATLLWWIADPAVALPAFLPSPFSPFCVEDAPDGILPERISRGIALVAGPAALHIASYRELLLMAGGAPTIANVVPLLAVGGGLASGALLLLARCRRDARLALGVGALLLLPPLVGFTCGFLVLHALPQTIERRDRLGCASTMAYLKTVMPVSLAALILSALIAGLLQHFDPSGVRGLFAAIAALAFPHLLVTPWFEAQVSIGRTRIGTASSRQAAKLAV